MTVYKVFAILAMICLEVASVTTLYTTWFGKGMKDALAGIFLFIPIIALAVFAGSLFAGAFGVSILKQFWWLFIPAILVVVTVVKGV